MKNQTFSSSNGVNGPAPAIAKAATVLQAVGEAEATLGVSEIARRTGLSKSTAHGLLMALLETGFLAFSEQGKSYALGPRLLELGSMSRDHQLRSAAESTIGRLSDRSGETALFGRLAGDCVIILARNESSRPLNLSAAVGSTVPIVAGALGKAYLASLEPDKAAQRVRAIPLAAFTPRSITTVDEYLCAVATARKLGYAIDRGEYLTGIMGVASAFPWFDTTCFAWIVGIDAAHRDEDLHQLGRAVRDAATSINVELDGHMIRKGSRGAS